MTAPTPAMQRAAEGVAKELVKPIHLEGHFSIARSALEPALDVEEVTEALAREQWDSMPLVQSGEMSTWDEYTDDPGLGGARFEKASFRLRCRPYAEAVIRSVLGES